MKKYLLFPFLVLSLFIWTGCDDDDPVNNDIIRELKLPVLNAANTEYFGDTQNPISQWINGEGKDWEYTSYQTLLTDDSKIFTFDCISPSTNTGVEAGYCFSNLKTGKRSAITGRGVNNDTYIISYQNDYLQKDLDIAIRFQDASNKPTKYVIDGLFITNAYTAVNVIENGEALTSSEPFKEGDWFKLRIYNLDKSKYQDFYLADFQNGKTEIVKEWKWVDLSKFGEIDGLRFELTSSDTGIHGMNTPAYFCLDGIKLIEKAKK